MSTRNHSLEAKLKHSRKQLYQRTKPMKSKHGRQTAAAAINTRSADARGPGQEAKSGDCSHD